MTAFRRAAWLGLVTLITTLGTSCDDDLTGSDGAIAIAVEPTTVSVSQGAASFVTVTVNRSGGFDGTVQVMISNLPNGVTATMNPATLLPAITTSRIDLTASAAAVPGSYLVTIAASSPGVDPVHATVNLTITTYSISVTPLSLTVEAGASATAIVTIDRQGYTGPVELQLIGAPAGVQGTFDPAAPITNSSSLTLTVGANVMPGSYALVVAEAGPLPDRTVPIQLTVVAAPGGSGNIEYRYCDAAETPVFFAFQDGGGAWQEIPATVFGGSTRFPFTISSGRGGILAVFQSEGAAIAARTPAFRTRSRYAGRTTPPHAGGGHAAAVGDVYATVVLFGSTAELADDGAATCAATLPARSVIANVTSINAGQYGVLSLGNVTKYYNGAMPPATFTFDGVKGGLVDFVGSRIVTPGLPPDRALIYRNLDPPDGSTLPMPINFNSADAFAPATATATITGGNNDALEVFNEVVTATSHVLLWSDLAPSATASRPWVGLSPARQLTTDIHGLIVFASAAGTNGDFRVASKYVGPVTNQTLAMGAAVNAAAMSAVAGGNYPRYRFQGVLPAEYNKGVAINIVSEEGGNEILLMAARGYLAAAGAADAYDLTMPDVSMFSGFPTEARLSSGANLVATDAFGFTGSGVFELRPVIGSEFRASVRVTMLAVP